MFVVPELYIDIQPEQFLKELYGGPTRVVRIAPKHIRRTKHPQKLKPQQSEENALVLKLDVSKFQPEEITVKLEENLLVIIAQHEENNGELDSFVNYMVKKTRIPEIADLDGIVSTFSKDGILTVTVPKKVEMKEVERIIPIIRTGEVLRVEAIEKTTEDENKVIKNDTLETKEEEKELIQANTEEKKLSVDINTDSDTRVVKHNT